MSIETARSSHIPVVALLQDAKKVAPLRALHCHQTVVTPIHPSRLGRVQGLLSLLLLERIDNELGQPEGMEEGHRIGTSGYRPVLDRGHVRYLGIEFLLHVR